MTYTLYYSPGTASMVVHLALLEIGAPHTLQRVDFDSDEQHGAEYLELNAGGTVPTLIINGKAFNESGALLMILAERHPDAGLAPAAGTPEHDAWTQWIVYLSNALMSTYRLWFYPAELGSDTHDPAIRAALQKKIEGIWDRLDAHLATNGPYLLGAQCSGADLMLAMLMRWSRNMPRPVSQWPALNQLAALIRTRPSWQRLHEIEALDGW